MNDSKFTNTISNDILFVQLAITACLVSVTIFPFLFDSFTVSKLLIWSLGLIYLIWNAIKRKSAGPTKNLSRLLKLFIVLFLILMVNSWALSGVPFYRGAFGQFGRGNGLFYYFFAILTLVIAAKFYSNSIQAKVNRIMIYFSWFLVIYATLQRVGIDIAELDTRGLSAVVLTFGNNNFAGGMIAILFSYHFIYLIVSQMIKRSNVVLLLALVIASYFTAAVQSYLIIAFAILFGLSILAKQKCNSRLVLPAIVASWAIGILFLVLGVAGKSIFAEIFARNSFQIRLEYWRIALSMLKDNFFFGIGPDKMYDLTPKYMTPGSINLVTSTRIDSAHNWFLNLAVNYGMLAMLCLLVILGYAIFIGIRNFSSNMVDSPFVCASLVALISTIIDGLVSIEQPGLGIWLYFFAGVALGSSPAFKTNLCPNSKLESKVGENSYKLIGGFTVILLFISFIIISNRITQDGLLRNSVRNAVMGDVTPKTLQTISSVAIHLKSEPEYAYQSIRILAAAGDKERLNTVSKAFFDYYPSSFQGRAIRADVLDALGFMSQSCPLRDELLSNEPFSRIQLKAYLVCASYGYLPTVSKDLLSESVQYLRGELTIKADPNEKRVLELRTTFTNFAIISRLDFYLGKTTLANFERSYAQEVFKKLIQIESGMSEVPQFSQLERSQMQNFLTF